MGATESRAQVTPSRPLINRHLAHVTDPRSPTAGIPRTPIEVGDSPQRTPLAEQEEDLVMSMEIADPRSPTQGIVRTPLRPSLHASLNLLAKQLSEVFVAEDTGIEGSPPADAEAPAAVSEDQPVSKELDLPSPDLKEPEPAEEAVVSQTVEPEASVEQTPPVLKQQKPRGKSPHGTGAKNVRQRPKKTLLSSAPGRSPLKILLEDNSPSNVMQNRQVKKTPLQSEQPSSLSNLKISYSSWEMSRNKENTQYTHSES